MLYQIENAIDTIPSTSAAAIALNPNLSGQLAGTVTSNAPPFNEAVLNYSGSNDVGEIYTLARVNRVQSIWWLFVKQTFVSLTATPLLARVIGCTQLANNSWTIMLDRNYPGLISQGSLYFLRGPSWYSIGVDGAEAIAMLDGELGSAYSHPAQGDSISPKGWQLNAQNIKYYAPVYIDATGSGASIELQV